MKSYLNLKISKRLGLGFGLLLALLAGITGMATVSLRDSRQSIHEIVQINIVERGLETKMQNATNAAAAAARDIVLVTDEPTMHLLQTSLQKSRGEYDDAEQRLTRMFLADAGTTAKEREMLSAIKEHRVIARAAVNQVVELGLVNRNEEATALLMKSAKPALQTWLDGIARLGELDDALNDQVALRAEQAMDRALQVMLVLAGLSLVLGAAAGWLIARSITRALGGEPDYASTIARQIAAGNLAVDVEVNGNADECLLGAMRDMRDNLAIVVGQVRQSSDSIATGSSQIGTGNADLSKRTEEQAANLQQTAASMEQLTATVKQNSDTAIQANQLASVASAAASRGGQVVGKVVVTMEQITSSSRRIADIISVIDGIAFQTNILALNAAVEAARAGEQGRGFAVVASEVRSLAQRSAAAAKEIKSLIAASVEDVEQGARLANDAGTSMAEIVNQVRRVSDLIAEMSAAGQEQSIGISQVGDAVSQLDQVTQQNAALVEESAAAAESLKQQAVNLAGFVSQFKLAR